MTGNFDTPEVARLRRELQALCDRHPRLRIPHPIYRWRLKRAAYRLFHRMLVDGVVQLPEKR